MKTVETRQDEVVISAEDHHQPIEIRFRNGTVARFSVTGMSSGVSFVVEPLPEQKVSFSAVNEESVLLPLSVSGYTYADGSPPIEDLPLPENRHAVHVVGSGHLHGIGEFVQQARAAILEGRSEADRSKIAGVSGSSQAGIQEPGSDRFDKVTQLVAQAEKGETPLHMVIRSSEMLILGTPEMTNKIEQFYRWSKADDRFFLVYEGGEWNTVRGLDPDLENYGPYPSRQAAHEALQDPNFHDELPHYAPTAQERALMIPTMTMVAHALKVADRRANAVAHDAETPAHERGGRR